MEGRGVRPGQGHELEPAELPGRRRPGALRRLPRTRLSALEPASFRYRFARPADAPAIAALHADSWRRTYRGLLTDAYLDDVVPGERAAEWAARLGEPGEAGVAVLAEAGGTLWGFAHVVADHDPALGSYLSALHVDHRARRRGLAARLLAECARWLAGHATSAGLYLEVVEANPTARASYERLGGREVGRDTWHAPDGSAVVDLVYAWDDLAPLLARLPPT